MVDERDERADNLNLPWVPVVVANATGTSPFLFVCEHASNFIPESFAGLGLNEEELRAHIAWDPGAVEVARHLSNALDACLIEARFSRLLVDCNRPLDATDLIPETSETTRIPGNQSLNPSERKKRIELSHAPFHQQIEQAIEERSSRGQPSWVVTIHSFTPIYHGVHRPWQIGIIHDADERIAKPLIAALQNDQTLTVGINEPYSPADRVYYTLERHARPRNAPCVMIEFRNDVIASAQTQKQWAERIASIFEGLMSTISSEDTTKITNNFTEQKA